jgi:hypothetical protein
MALFAMIGKTEATSRGWLPELDNKKSGGSRLAPTGLRQNTQEILISVADCLKTPRRWLPELDLEKRRRLSKEDNLKAPLPADLRQVHFLNFHIIKMCKDSLHIFFISLLFSKELPQPRPDGL